MRSLGREEGGGEGGVEDEGRAGGRGWSKCRDRGARDRGIGRPGTQCPKRHSRPYFTFSSRSPSASPARLRLFQCVRP